MIENGKRTRERENEQEKSELVSEEYIGKLALVFTHFDLKRFVTFREFKDKPLEVWDKVTQRGDFWANKKKVYRIWAEKGSYQFGDTVEARSQEEAEFKLSKRYGFGRFLGMGLRVIEE